MACKLRHSGGRADHPAAGAGANDAEIHLIA
jgi:hypothetical protein